MANFWLKLQRPFVVLAPMEEVTDFVFREMFLTLPRPDVFFTEFTSVDGIVFDKHERTRQKLKFSEGQRPIVAQIWGNNPENFFKASKTVSQMWFDGVDINMGCPERQVIKRGCGAGLIENKTLAIEIIQAVCEGSGNLPVSVKTRIGIGKVVTEEWIGFLLSQKLAALIVHGRTAKQMSAVPADWREIQKAVELKNTLSQETVVVGNGDINNYPEALNAHKKYGVDGVMIGRGIFSNPWAFEKTAVGAVHLKDEYLKVLVTHLQLFERTWGKTKNFHIMKKFFKMYVRNFDGANKVRQELMECNSVSEAEELLKQNLRIFD